MQCLLPIIQNIFYLPWIQPAVGVISFETNLGTNLFLNALRTLRTLSFLLCHHLGTRTNALHHCWYFFKIMAENQKYTQIFRSHHIHLSHRQFFTNQETKISSTSLRNSYKCILSLLVLIQNQYKKTEKHSKNSVRIIFTIHQPLNHIQETQKSDRNIMIYFSRQNNILRAKTILCLSDAPLSHIDTWFFA